MEYSLEDADRYVEALGEVGTGVLEPLAVGVALPLLNLTLRGLGNFAIPLVSNFRSCISSRNNALVGTCFAECT